MEPQSRVQCLQYRFAVLHSASSPLDSSKSFWNIKNSQWTSDATKRNNAITPTAFLSAVLRAMVEGELNIFDMYRWACGFSVLGKILFV
jgi:hypothetical protein